VFSASKITFDLFKPQFAFSFWCFPQAKSPLTYSNPSLLSHLGIFRKQKPERMIAIVEDFKQFNPFPISP
jgi:hypothetical protein